MRPVSELVNDMSMSDVVDYLIEMEQAFVVTKEDINKLKADAVREAKLYLLRNGFGYGAPYKLDELIEEIERGC